VFLSNPEDLLVCAAMVDSDPASGRDGRPNTSALCGVKPGFPASTLVSRSSRLRIITSMQKLFLNVAAVLVFVALVILAQAPDGAAPAFKGPDAVAAEGDPRVT
jgi:hypothetical protein